MSLCSGAHERRLRRFPVPHASWGSEIQWEKASIASNKQAAKGVGKCCNVCSPSDCEQNITLKLLYAAPQLGSRYWQRGGTAISKSGPVYAAQSRRQQAWLLCHSLRPSCQPGWHRRAADQMQGRDCRAAVQQQFWCVMYANLLSAVRGVVRQIG